MERLLFPEIGHWLRPMDFLNCFSPILKIISRKTMEEGTDFGRDRNLKIPCTRCSPAVGVTGNALAVPVQKMKRHTNANWVSR